MKQAGYLCVLLSRTWHGEVPEDWDGENGVGEG